MKLELVLKFYNSSLSAMVYAVVHVVYIAAPMVYTVVYTGAAMVCTAVYTAVCTGIHWYAYWYTSIYRSYICVFTRAAIIPRNKEECTRSGLRVALKDLPILRTRIYCQNLTELKALYFSKKILDKENRYAALCQMAGCTSTRSLC